MLAWPHSGFHVHDEVRVPADDRPFAVRLARYRARNPVALGRLDHKDCLTRGSDVNMPVPLSESG